MTMKIYYETVYPHFNFHGMAIVTRRQTKKKVGMKTLNYVDRVWRRHIDTNDYDWWRWEFLSHFIVIAGHGIIMCVWSHFSMAPISKLKVPMSIFGAIDYHNHNGYRWQFAVKWSKCRKNVHHSRLYFDKLPKLSNFLFVSQFSLLSISVWSESTIYTRNIRHIVVLQAYINANCPVISSCNFRSYSPNWVEISRTQDWIDLLSTNEIQFIKFNKSKS